MPLLIKMYLIFLACWMVLWLFNRMYFIANPEKLLNVKLGIGKTPWFFNLFCILIILVVPGGLASIIWFIISIL